MPQNQVILTMIQPMLRSFRGTGNRERLFGPERVGAGSNANN